MEAMPKPANKGLSNQLLTIKAIDTQALILDKLIPVMPNGQPDDKFLTRAFDIAEAMLKL